MKPPMTGTCPASSSGFTFDCKRCVGLFKLRHRAHVGASVTMHSRESTSAAVNAPRGESRSHNLAGKEFAEGGDVVGGARRQLADGGDAAQQFVERLEVGAQVAVKVR